MAKLIIILVFAFAAACTSTEEAPDAAGTAQPDEGISGLSVEPFVQIDAASGQVVYVPVYSQIYYRDGNRELLLTATLSIRNTDMEQAIAVTSIRYYDSAGKLVKRHLDRPITLAPLASTSVVVEERDKTGGVGANFIVEWRSETSVSPPVVEAVMISTAGTQGISFISPGRVIQNIVE